MRVSRPLRIDGLQWHRHSCLPRGTKGLCAFARLSTRRMPNALGSLPLKILIANARLEFNVSHSKDNPLRISNRERIAISNRIQPPRPRSARQLPLNTRLPRGASPPTKGHCISNRNISHFRISSNSHSGNTYAFSNRNKASIASALAAPPFLTWRRIIAHNSRATLSPARKLTPPQRTPILILPPKENRHGKPRHTKRRPNPYRKIYGRTLSAHRD
jgi:hypothetical protein